MKYLILALALSLPLSVGARSGTEYDPTTGNVYYWFESAGGYDIYGVNPKTGSIWDTHTFSGGSMMGTDADNNPWAYDGNSTLYTNQRTFETCYGLGALRECF